MSKSFYSLGLMSGTSMDGIDASIIQSDGENRYKVIKDQYFKFSKALNKDLIKIRDKINNFKDLKKLSKKIKIIEKRITFAHFRAVKKILKESKINIDMIGFHGQTIFHSAKKKFSKQLGDGKLLSKLTKKTVVYNFRKNDLKNGGQGAPLTPIFHKLLEKKFKVKPVIFINIGGVANKTIVKNNNYFSATDIGPGMCLIDQWIRKNTKKKYDLNGSIAQSGNIDKVKLNKALSSFFRKNIYKKNNIVKSFDIKDFDNLFVKNLSVKDGAATLVEYTASIISSNIKNIKKNKVILCGGGRKNKFLIKKIKNKNINLKLIDDYKIDGDFIESQAFAYLAIRSYLKKPISFPKTTGVTKPCTGGIIIKN
jgi:anhydro-N-acetylmuramic acid kinase